MCVSYIPYMDLIGEPIIKITYPEVIRLQLSITNVREQYLKYFENIFDGQKIEVRTDLVYGNTTFPPNQSWINKKDGKENIRKK